MELPTAISVQYGADGVVTGLECDVLRPGEDAESDPPVAPVADRAGRETRAGDRFVGAADSRDIRELAEDDPIVDAWTVAAQGRSASQCGRSGSSAEKRSHSDSISHDGRAGTGFPGDHSASQLHDYHWPARCSGL
jgi:hypothetical protein